MIAVRGDRAAATHPPRPTRRSGSRSCPGRSTSSTGAIDRVPRLEVADRPAAARAHAPRRRRLAEPGRTACPSRGSRSHGANSPGHGHRDDGEAPGGAATADGRPTPSSAACSTSSPTSSSSAACRATRSRPTAPTCSSTAPSWPSAASTRTTRRAADVSDFLTELATGERQRRGRVLAGDDPPQGRVPALLLPPPAPRGAASSRRPDRDADAAAARPQAAPGAQPRRGQAPARAAAGHRPDRAARPRAAGADVRLRAARLRGDRARGRRRRPRARRSCAPAARAPRSGSCRSGSQAAAAVRALPALGPPAAGRRPPREPQLFVNFRGGSLTRQGLYKIIHRHARSGRARAAR